LTKVFERILAKQLTNYLETNHIIDEHQSNIRQNILSTSTRKLLVTAMVIPIIDYCSLVLIDISKRLDCKLQRLINNGIRFIFNLKRDEHITPYRCSLQWLTDKSKRSYFLACFLYKLFSSGEPSFLRSFFVKEYH
ncbi:GSCOCG00006996001-RA-CDS, partial [Cotesia congregata]